ncbi:MAG: metallophosphoesterase [Bryobacterales bacterium]|nr:metallophosphoesterase [Bryobacterales bacterium]
MWTFSDAHVGTDKRNGRESLASSLEQAESDFPWDLALDLGDQSGGQSVPQDDEGQEIVRQFGKGLRRHTREQIYSLAGNHDRSGLDEPQNWWWRKWLDPLGETPQHSRLDARNRPYAVEGTWERYSFQVGNMLFLMMSDINEPSQTIGRGPLGGNPSGVVSGETFAWWKRMVEANQDKIIVSAHHYVLKDTTVASGEWEGMRRDENGQWRSHYHGYKEQGTPKGASYLYWVDSKPDAQAFERYLAANPGAIDIWLGGHTHTNPDDTYGGKSHVERKWGVWFVNVSALTAHHVGRTTVPMSRVWTFEGDQALVRCYQHTARYAPQGFYQKAERRLQLSKAYLP